MIDERNNNDLEMGESLNADDIRCMAPGKFRIGKKLICGRRPSYLKITERMVGVRPRKGWSAQPIALCHEHWPKYKAVGALDGEVKRPQPRWPGKVKGGESIG